jgi:hypothetical protein
MSRPPTQTQTTTSDQKRFCTSPEKMNIHILQTPFPSPRNYQGDNEEGSNKKDQQRAASKNDEGKTADNTQESPHESCRSAKGIPSDRTPTSFWKSSLIAATVAAI